ncbi:hypothetical protein ACG2F4_17380 [Halalkalibaculum sp. DA3122]
MKKEPLQQVLGETRRAEKCYFPGGAPTGNIWGSFSRSEVQPGE